ncbi:MAG: FKBP-type peptidyl-prolyl cis-trans isomerase [Saprospiraceae bacterium]|nr:FKBP-type peptidyl-prolyl cis-trans isomerase [Saprospiraceae bacterium]
MQPIMMRIAMLLVVSALIILTSCQNGGGKQVSSQGWEYVNHTSLDAQMPQPGDYIFFHATMRNQDSVYFDSRSQPESPYLQIPVTPNPQRRISPVEDVLAEVAEGDSVTIFIDLDTVQQPPRGFTNEDVMEYDVKVLEVKNEQEYQAFIEQKRAEQAEKAAVVQARAEGVKTLVDETLEKYKNGTLENLIETPSGLKYVIHEQGNGNKPNTGQAIDVQYYGVLAADGTMFDNSFSRGQAIRFPFNSGRVIKGWDEGLGYLTEGAKATFFIPSELGYGAAGSPPAIPANSELVFYVELEKLY